jgi:hypothetical protein
LKIIKKYKLIIIGLFVIVLLAIIFYAVDATRATQSKVPIFTFIIWTVKDGGSRVYTGLGYNVRIWHKIYSKQIAGKEVRGFLTGYTVTSIYKFLDINESGNKLVFTPQ